MQNLNYWMQFENTGKVEDYLSYCTCFSHGADRKNIVAKEKEQQTGVNPYAGIPMGNGNGIETDAYR